MKRIDLQNKDLVNSVLNELKTKIFEDHRNNKDIMIEELLYQGSLVFDKLYDINRDYNFARFIYKNQINKELIEYYYIMCLIIAEKYCIDNWYSFTQMFSYLNYVNNPILRLKKYYTAYERNILKLIEYKIPCK